jgi:hypothetical protein
MGSGPCRIFHVVKDDLPIVVILDTLLGARGLIERWRIRRLSMCQA